MQNQNQYQLMSYRIQLDVPAQGTARNSISLTDEDFVCQNIYALAYFQDGTNCKIHTDRTENTDIIYLELRSNVARFMNQAMDIIALNKALNNPTNPLGWYLRRNTELTAEVTHDALSDKYNIDNAFRVDVYFNGYQKSPR